ncbi:MAG TPA: enoyl-CoA hydratase-related protein [Propionibacteriaceae bacterium]|nr:enoyl-CoA hydratase-related protein [Propionibacteriaceae bacterium]
MSVRVERPAPLVAELTLDRPEALNAISTDVARQLAVACEEILEDDALSAVIMTSSTAKAFCVGADLKERAAFSDHDLRRQRPIIEDAFGAVRNMPIPTIAAVEGYALGGGCELALSCDLIVASQTAVFGLPEVGLGLIPGGGGTQLLPRRVGWNRAADLIFTGRRIDGNDAFRIGIADRLVPAGTAREMALQLAVDVAANSPVSLRAAKLALRRGFDVDLPSGLLIENESWEHAAYSEDRREGIAAFVGRRKPRWPSARRDG